MMLPASEDMHRGRVDLLHDAEAPAIDFRAGHRSGLTVRRTTALNDADRQSWSMQECCVPSRSDVAAAARQPQSPENMSLYWPHSPKSTVAPAGIQALLIPAFTNHTSFSLAALSDDAGRDVAVEVPSGLHWRAVVLLVLIQAIDEQARRNVHDGRAHLEDVGILPVVLEGRATTTEQRTLVQFPAHCRRRRSSPRRSAGYSQPPRRT